MISISITNSNRGNYTLPNGLHVLKWYCIQKIVHCRQCVIIVYCLHHIWSLFKHFLFVHFYFLFFVVFWRRRILNPWILCAVSYTTGTIWEIVYFSQRCDFIEISNNNENCVWNEPNKLLCQKHFVFAASLAVSNDKITKALKKENNKIDCWLFI